jgi:hypothetical protein
MTGREARGMQRSSGNPREGGTLARRARASTSITAANEYCAGVQADCFFSKVSTGGAERVITSSVIRQSVTPSR